MELVHDPAEAAALMPAQPTPGIYPDEVHQLLVAALDPVPLYVCVTTAAAPQLRPEPSNLQWPNVAGGLPERPVGMVSVHVDVTSTDPAGNIAATADTGEDLVIESLWPDRSTNWPPCPHHPESHPMAARVLDGHPMWTCPRDGRPVVAIGSLATTPGRAER